MQKLLGIISKSYATLHKVLRRVLTKKSLKERARQHPLEAISNLWKLDCVCKVLVAAGEQAMVLQAQKSAQAVTKAIEEVKVVVVVLSVVRVERGSGSGVGGSVEVGSGVAAWSWWAGE